MTSVGVVGLGAMGRPVARHLLAAGHEVWCVDLDPSVGQELAALGAHSATVGEMAERVEVVLIFVPTDDDVRAVCLGPDALLASLRPGAAVAVCSSVLPETCVELASAAAPGVDVVDAALTGGVRGAEEGRVNLLVGGDADTLDRLRAVFGAFCSSVHHLGPLGTGQIGKAANNLVHWAQVAAITEALRLADACGVSVPALRRALMDGPVDSRTLRELEDFRFTWYAKDLANASALGSAHGLDLPLAAVAGRAMEHITVASTARLLGAGPSAPDESM